MHSDLMEKLQVMNSDIYDKVMHSRMLEELKALPHEVLMELKALQGG